MLVLVFTPLSCVCVSVCVLLIRPFNIDIRGRIPCERIDIVQKHVIGVPDDHAQFVPVVDLKQHTTQIVPPSSFYFTFLYLLCKSLLFWLAGLDVNRGRGWDISRKHIHPHVEVTLNNTFTVNNV